ncbi:MAG: PTS sugar transporter subunit IIA [Betaproteobacteria bacterium]|jgi:PTS system mannose-specific IIA component|nr:PTS sugar transporter subunit IIA [Betaproteobacteria bacterium]
MIGVLIIGHDALPASLAAAVAHVLGERPPQFDVLSVACDDDPLDVLPRARAAVARLDTGDGVLVFSDIYGATPCNLVGKLVEAGRIEAVAGVNLPMLVRALTYRDKGLETMAKKAVSGGCEGVLRLEAGPVHAATRG